MFKRIFNNEYMINSKLRFKIGYKFKPCRGIRWILNLGFLVIVKWEEGE